MISFSKFGSHGNLGNQLHQYASLIGFTEKYGCELILPEWKYARYFKYPPKQGFVKSEMLVEEPYYHYTPEFWDAYQRDFRTKNVDILGWLQTEKYWQHCKEKVHYALQFEETFQNNVKAKFKKALQKETIAISIRRGDFITNPNFYFLPMEYYLGALQLYFPEYRKCNVIFFSDDLEYCYTAIKHYANFYFPLGLNGIEQLCLMSHCTHFIISNSTFSWWGAILGEKTGSTIVRPEHFLVDIIKDTINCDDYFPERWKTFNHTDKQININNFKITLLEKQIAALAIRAAKFHSKNVKRLQYRVDKYWR